MDDLLSPLIADTEFIGKMFDYLGIPVYLMLLGAVCTAGLQLTLARPWDAGRHASTVYVSLSLFLCSSTMLSRTGGLQCVCVEGGWGYTTSS